MVFPEKMLISLKYEKLTLILYLFNKCGWLGVAPGMPIVGGGVASHGLEFSEAFDSCIEAEGGQ